MTRVETIQIITAIKLAYPTFGEKTDDKTFTCMVDFWHKFFEGDSYKLVEFAVQRHISTNKWLPSIADVREQIAKLKRPDLIPPDIAWETVSDYIYSRDCYVQLPPLIAKVVETIGTYTLKECRGGYDKQLFMELYKPAYEREFEKAMLPKALCDQIAKSDEALGGEIRRSIEQISEARKKEQKLYDEAMKRQYVDHNKLIEYAETKDQYTKETSYG